MLRDAAVTEIQERLGFRTDRSTEIIARLKSVQSLLEMGRTLPWFLEATATLAVLANEDRAFPVGLIREVRDPKRLGVYYFSSDVPPSPVSLRKMDEMEAYQTFGVGDGTAPPSAYMLGPTSFILFPRHHLAEPTFTINYYKHALVLDSNIENVWLLNAPYLLIGNAGASFAQTLQQTAAYNEFTALAQQAWATVFAEDTERKVANRQFVVGRNS